MPRPQTYGKRRKALFQAAAIWSSPENDTNHAPTKTKLDGRDEEFEATNNDSRAICEGLKKLNLVQQDAIQPKKEQCGQDRGESMRLRAVLGEKDANAPVVTISELKDECRSTVEDALPLGKKTAKIQKASERRPLGDQLQDECTAVPLSSSPKPIGKSPKQPRSRATRSTKQPKEQLDQDILDTSQHKTKSQSKRDAAGSRQIASLDELNAYCEPLLSLIEEQAFQATPTPFNEYSAALAPHCSLAKFAEASYGEVYRLTLKNDTQVNDSSEATSILKVIPIRPPPPPSSTKTSNGTQRKPRLSPKHAWMSSIPAIRAEVQLLRLLQPVPGFTLFRDLRVLVGRPDAYFSTAWKTFDKNLRIERLQRDKDHDAHRDPREKGSEFPDPTHAGSYSPTQLWAVLEMGDAGTDLEKVLLSHTNCANRSDAARFDTRSAWDVFWSVVLSVAQAEHDVAFEHRDLHLGNICVRFNEPHRDIRSGRHRLGATGIETTVIDYTLSRAEDRSASSPQKSLHLSSNEAGEDEQSAEVIYTDLSLDPALFLGDASVDEQYEYYRYMRSAMLLDDAMADMCLPAVKRLARKSERSWSGFHAQTNVLWLGFLGKRLVEYLDSNMEREVDDEAERLKGVLMDVSHRISPQALGEGDIKSAGQLLAFAVERGWLSEDDLERSST